MIAKNARPQAADFFSAEWVARYGAPGEMYAPAPSAEAVNRVPVMRVLFPIRLADCREDRKSAFQKCGERAAICFRGSILEHCWKSLETRQASPSATWRTALKTARHKGAMRALENLMGSGASIICGLEPLYSSGVQAGRAGGIRTHDLLNPIQ